MEIIKRILNIIKNWFATDSCIHTRYGYVEQDGFQYCISCNIAKLPELPECQHTLTIKEVWQKKHSWDEKHLVKIYTVCTKCGKVENF